MENRIKNLTSKVMEFVNAGTAPTAEDIEQIKIDLVYSDKDFSADLQKVKTAANNLLSVMDDKKLNRIEINPLDNNSEHSPADVTETNYKSETETADFAKGE